MTVYARSPFGLRLFVLLIAMMAGGAFAAGHPEVFKARLSPLGVTAVTVNTITGIGSATATLEGARLTIDTTFEGLTGAALSANIRRGPKGIPGPVVFDLPISKTTSDRTGGKITAMLDLSAEQVSDLRAGRWYLQIHSERAPEGSIRGWLLQ